VPQRKFTQERVASLFAGMEAANESVVRIWFNPQAIPSWLLRHPGFRKSRRRDVVGMFWGAEVRTSGGIPSGNCVLVGDQGGDGDLVCGWTPDTRSLNPA